MSTERVLILGSGLSSKTITGFDWTGWTIVAINNAWRLVPDRWNYLVMPSDFFGFPHQFRADQRFVLVSEYNRAVNLAGGTFMCGDTMIFNATYWALDALAPQEIGFLGCDLVYPRTGETHFYGKGRPDFLRYGKQYLLRCLQTLQSRLEVAKIKATNFSLLPTLLPFSRVCPKGVVAPTVQWPQHITGPFAKMHPVFIRNLLAYGGARIVEQDIPQVSKVVIRIGWNGREVLFDFSDFNDVPADIGNALCFKMHYDLARHWMQPNIAPFSPITFCDWEQFFRLEQAIKYRDGSRVICKFRPRNIETSSKVLFRRHYVQTLLTNLLGSTVDPAFVDQEPFWQQIEKALCMVHVPGARCDIADRSVLQYMAFGCPVVMPRVNLHLPRYTTLKPGVHYVECAGDFSDVLEQIKWVRENREAATVLGANAKRMFMSNLVPRMMVEYMSGICDGA
jgi:hypothetical protein